MEEEDAHQAKGAASVEGMAKAFHCVGHKKLWKLLKEMGIPGFEIKTLVYSIQYCTVKYTQAQSGTSLAVQWLRICLPIQRTQVRSLVRELRSHMLQGKPAHHSY